MNTPARPGEPLALAKAGSATSIDPNPNPSGITVSTIVRRPGALSAPQTPWVPACTDGCHSREGALVTNNILLAVSSLVVFVGTIWPLIAEIGWGAKLSVGEPFFNAAFTPFMVVLAVLLPVGSTLAWKRGECYSGNMNLTLEAAIERISQCYLGFYFGRYDLRAASVGDLMAGRNFKILELNGVTSEATHIYDPRHGLLYAYRTLFEQWRMAFEIGAANRACGAVVTSLAGLLKAWRHSTSTNNAS